MPLWRNFYSGNFFLEISVIKLPSRHIIGTNKITISCSKTKVTIKSFKLLYNMISSKDKNSASNAMVEEGVSDVRPMDEKFKWDCDATGVTIFIVPI